MYIDTADVAAEDRQKIASLAKTLSAVVEGTSLPKRILDRQKIETMCHFDEAEYEGALNNLWLNFAYSASLALIIVASTKLKVGGTTRLCGLSSPEGGGALLPSAAVVLYNPNHDDGSGIIFDVIRHEMIHVSSARACARKTSAEKAESHT